MLFVVLAHLWAQAPAAIARPGSAPEAKFSISDVTVKEGSSGRTKAMFKVTLSRTTEATVHFATVDRTATAGSDFADSSGTLTFGNGQQVRRIVVRVFGDRDVELDETFRVRLSKAFGGTIADGTALGTIRNDDTQTGTPSLSVGDATVTEGDDGTTPATFDVVLSTASSSPVTVDFETAPGSADSAVDYHPASGTLVFDPGQTTSSVPVSVTGDDTAETDETFLLILSNPSGATIANGTGLGTISNDDGGPPTTLLLSIGDATVTEGNSGTTSAVFDVTLSAASVSTVTVAFATSSGSATSAVDFHPATGTLVFAPAETTKSVLVRVEGDTTVETNESFLVILSNASGATIANGTGFGTIVNDDGVALPSISIAAVTQAEGNSGSTPFVFNLTLSAPSSSTVTVDYATADGSAAAPADYAAAAGTVTFTPGQTSRQAIVQVVGETIIETNEAFTLSLSNPTNATLAGSGSAVGTITNDDALPSISIAAPTALAEGNSGTTAFVFNLTLSAPSSSAVTVDYATADGSAAAPADYAAAAGTVTFTPGQTSRQIVVQVLGDTTIETNETFSVNLSNPTNATVAGSGSAVGTITNDDAPPSISIAAVTLAEGNSGNTAFVFNLTLSAASSSTVTVDFATADGAATAPADYASTFGTVTFNPGQTSRQIVVQVRGDTLHETNETFSVNLSNPTHATIAGSGFALGTITNDDAIPTLSINNITSLEGGATTYFVFTVTLSAASGQTVTVDFATANGTATAPSDYAANSGVLTYVPGTITQTVTIQVAGDAIAEPNETFTVNLSNATNAMVSGTGIGTGTITNDD